MKMADPELPCDGCAHSASGAPFPGHPSGERPCCFCVRNPEPVDPSILYPAEDAEPNSYVEKARTGKRGDGIWYDGTPAIKTPMDCYMTLDKYEVEAARIAARQ